MPMSKGSRTNSTLAPERYSATKPLARFSSAPEICPLHFTVEWAKDYRPHQKQMVVSVIMDQDGRPVCSEMWPGDTADVTTLIPVIDRLRQRFAIGRVCVVADRGMISAQTIASLEERGLEYILGVRERSSKEVQEVVLNDPAPSVSLVIPRRGRRDTELEAKEVRVGGRRYIVCRNLAEAKRDAEVREAVLRHLRSALRGGDKALVGNSAYRRYLKTPDEKHFEIDDNRVIEDARYDGLYVLRTNTTLNALAVMLRYRELLRVEDIFKTTKSILDTRPIYHKTDADHPRPRVLFVPGPRCSQSPGRSPRRGRRQAGMGPTVDGSRSAAGHCDGAGRQTLHRAHAGDRRCRPCIPGGRPCPAAQHARGRGCRSHA